MNKTQLASIMDHTLLKAVATPQQIEEFCHTAIALNTASVCVNPCYVVLAAKLLKDSPVKVCTVIGFPLGANTTAVKVFETKDAIANGAQEVDMVINLGALKSENWDLVEADIRSVVEAANGVLTKVIIECCYLTEEEKKLACAACSRAGADYVNQHGFWNGRCYCGGCSFNESCYSRKYESKGCWRHAFLEGSRGYGRSRRQSLGYQRYAGHSGRRREMIFLSQSH